MSTRPVHFASIVALAASAAACVAEPTTPQSATDDRVMSPAPEDPVRPRRADDGIGTSPSGTQSTPGGAATLSPAVINEAVGADYD